MSKRLVVNEQDSNQRTTYHKIIYTEFLEFIARCSDKWFEETEMAELPLARKILYFLEGLLATIGAKVFFQETSIDEFSDSD